MSTQRLERATRSNFLRGGGEGAGVRWGAVSSGAEQAATVLGWWRLAEHRERR